jgi:hypothetical protein
MRARVFRAILPAVLLIAGALAQGSSGSDLPIAARPGGRVLLDAHNCYPEQDRWNDRLERALGTGVPLAIEQDLVWYRDPSTGASRSIVSHGEPYSGREPSLTDHFFERVRAAVERAFAENRRERWPLIVLNLDLKSDEPEHHAALWRTLGEYESWLTTAARAADPARVMPFDVKPVLVLTGSAQAQQVSFHDSLPVGARLRLFGAIAVDVEAKVGRGADAADKLATLAPSDLIASGATNYRRWANFPWAAVEQGGQRQAGDWTSADRARLHALVDHAHAQNLWIRFYTLNGHAEAESNGWTASYNFGSLAAAQIRWRAARDAGVDFIATDQYEQLAAVVNRTGSDRDPRQK